MPQNFQDSLNETEIASLFNWITNALRVSITLDGVERLPAGDGCLIRSHDNYGQLPEMVIDFKRDKSQILDQISLSTAKLSAVAQFRNILANSYPDCKFIPPVSQKKGTLIGIQVGEKVIVAKGSDICRAYQKLSRKIA
jgi:hypothetical protein